MTNVTEEGHSYRLQHISQLRRNLEDEKNKRIILYKKYRRAVNIVDGIDTGLIAAGMASGIGGAAVLVTIVGAPVALGLSVTAIACGVGGVIGKYISRRLNIKTKKHADILTLSESKLNSIDALISTALMDGKISDVEFSLVINEVEKFTSMKNIIRKEANKLHADVAPAPAGVDDETKIM